MPKLCQFCAYHSVTDTETTCPTCGATLRFTLLPPADPLDPSAASLPPDETRSRPGSEGRGPWERLIGSPLVLVGVFFLIVVAVWAVSDTVMKGSGKGPDTSSRIRVGMHISEVGRILDNGPAPNPSYPRLRDSFPADEFGDGTIDYEGDGVILKIEFAGGYVTSVEESPSSAGSGFHRCQLVVRQR
jgi:hypothetical protein